MPAAAFAQYETAAANPPIEQPLVREGDLAVSLVEALGLGATEDETEAVNRLNSAGIAPRNGWIADYPVTPDIAGELQASIGEAADSDRLSMGKDAALIVFQDVIEENGLSIRVGEGQGAAGWGEEPASTDINNYYDTEGPPVVTYYAPPPAYAYMYTWVPYPFWWWNFWYPGFFVLVDFDVRFHVHERVHFRPHDRLRPHFHERVRPRPHDRIRPHERVRPRIDKDRKPGEFISNHFRDRRTDRVRRIDPTQRFRGETTIGDIGGARGEAGGTRGEMRGTRGFNTPRFRGGTRSSAFDRFGSTRIDGAASDRGFRSRSGAGIIPRRDVPGREVTPRRDAPGKDVPGREVSPYRSAPTRDRVDQGKTRTVEPRKRDVRKEGFRDSRGGTFHGGGRRNR